ncbi:D-2-hydroxyacid dehydrogenase family protein [Musicola paradisiaca]|uniref:D-isomer specific 2-hydroxyacid dehydrogenase NAD-binding n=1 Tax=Musicola paradisiaca (strain Ech703) TaxID=579405 RepID=C6CC15_MUSP7|nr:D-2-hydroxyacid dehydrogenase family protein [Musicola paradisiaca]ACS86775.1 D-isomer specific 2-hydroxyacid dehydrogenase NAD-binding [Musicola paradisiaca Ech703]
MNIAILDDYQDTVRHLSCFSLLSGHHVQILNQSYADPAALADKLRNVDALVLIRERTRITDELLSRLPKLALISQTGKISNHLDIDLCSGYGVAVAEGTGSPVAPSELCWALIMAASRRLPQYVSQLAAARWQQNGGHRLGRSLEGLALGIWGYGKIGQRIARYAQAFGMKVIIWGSESSKALAKQHGLLTTENKADFFRQADVLSLHLRLNAATRHCVAYEDLALMKPDSLFVNTSRAELIESGALLRILQEHPGRMAALDVFDHEPATPDVEPLLSLPNVLATPHIGYVEQNSYELYFKTAFENVNAFAEGRAQHLVNGDSLRQ